jgi:hypothetical protein
MKSVDRKRSKQIRFAICVAGDHFHLETLKVYRILPDAIAEKYDYVRVVDESREDYVYPRDHFVFINLPNTVQQLIPDIAPITPQKRKSARRRIPTARRPAARRRRTS